MTKVTGFLVCWFLNKLASALLIPAVRNWQDLIITSNYYKRSLQQQ